MSDHQGSSRILYASFNQDNSCFSIGVREGYKIFHSSTGRLFYENYDGAINIIEMLFSSSLVAFVGAGEQPTLSPRRLCMFNTASGHAAAELTFVTSILAVRMNQKRLVIVLHNKTYIYELAEMALIDTIETVPNTKGLCALSASLENCFLALPASTEVGAVLIYNALDLHTYCQIQAHQSPLAAIALSFDGSLLATASEHGTVIRVHRIVEAEKVHTFRRGSYPATIYSLSFGPASQVPQLLAATSSSGTVHIFKLDLSRKQRSKGASGILAAATNSMTGTSDPEQTHLIIRNVVPAGLKSICAITYHLQEASEAGSSKISQQIADRARLFLLSMNGYLSDYQLNFEAGKELSWVLQREFAVVASSSDQISAGFV